MINLGQGINRVKIIHQIPRELCYEGEEVNRGSSFFTIRVLSELPASSIQVENRKGSKEPLLIAVRGLFSLFGHNHHRGSCANPADLSANSKWRHICTYNYIQDCV